eukprot:891231-Prorocentrum_minimum.AAC.1
MAVSDSLSYLQQQVQAIEEENRDASHSTHHRLEEVAAQARLAPASRPSDADPCRRTIERIRKRDAAPAPSRPSDARVYFLRPFFFLAPLRGHVDEGLWRAWCAASTPLRAKPRRCPLTCPTQVRPLPTRAALPRPPPQSREGGGNGSNPRPRPLPRGRDSGTRHGPPPTMPIDRRLTKTVPKIA